MPPTGSRTRTSPAGSALAALGLTVAVALLGTYAFLHHVNEHRQDLTLYWTYGIAVARGLAPYRDFHPEYPPLALAYMTLPALVSARIEVYVQLLILLNALVAGLIALVVANASGHDRRGAFLMAAALLLLGSPLYPVRFDLFPALLTALAFRALVRGQAGWSGFWLGLGGAAKLYPGLLVPVFALALLARGRKRDAVMLCAVAAGVVFVALAPFIALDPTGVLRMFRFHALRGLQVESVAAGILLAWGRVSGVRFGVPLRFGCLEIVGPGVSAALRLLPFVLLLAYGAGLAGAWRAFRRDGTGPAVLARSALAALLAFVLAGKVFSPQFVAWLIPFVPLCGRRERALGLAVAALTVAIFPYGYGWLLQQTPVGVVLLNARNLLALVFLASALLALRRRSRPSLHDRGTA